MTRHARLWLGLIALAMLGCASGVRRGEPAPPSAQAMAPLSRAMLGAAPGGSVASSEALERLFEAPEVGEAGERLFGRLSDAPALQPLYADALAAVMQQPALAQSFARMAAADPSASVEDLTEQIVTRLAAGVDGPVFDAALDESIDRLFDRPPVDEAFGRMADALVERSRLEERLAALMVQWRPELEAALGVPMGDERFEARLQQHLADPARTAALSHLLSERLGDRAELREGLVALIDDDAFFDACAALVRSLLTGPEVHANLTSVLVGLIEDVDAPTLRQRVDRVLVTPHVERAVVVWLDAVTASEAFTALGERFGSVLDDPNLQAELFTIVIGAPAGPTA